MQESSLRVGQQNVEFTKHFLETERIPIVASYTEQQTGMHVQFHTHTNKVLVRLLDSKLSRAVEREDLRKSATVEKSMDQSDEAVLF